MFKRILVPLDGSSRAESALAVAARIVRASDGTVLLLRVAGIPAEYTTYLYGSYLAQTPMYAQEILDNQQAMAESYLADIARSDKLAGVKIERKVVTGSPPATILEVAREEHVDVIVICSHGDTGFKRWALGSVAQQISRHSPVPVLVLRENGTVPTSPFPDPLRPLRPITAMVALDGSTLAESAIEPAANLIAALAAPKQGILLLSRVVNLLAARNSSEAQQKILDDARTYLNGLVETLNKSPLVKLNLTIGWTLEAGKDVADALIRAAEDGEIAEGDQTYSCCDLLIMATHGRGGLQRWVIGSVTERVLGATKLPLLIVRPEPVHPEQQAWHVYRPEAKRA